MIGGVSRLVAVVLSATATGAGAAAAIIAAAATGPRAAVAAAASVTVVQLVVAGIARSTALAEVGREAASAATAATAAAAASGEARQEITTGVTRGAGVRSVATGRRTRLGSFPLPAAVSRRRRGGGGFLKMPVRTLSTRVRAILV
jgi:hypothetical protein